MSMRPSAFFPDVRPLGARLPAWLTLALALTSPGVAQAQSRWAVTGAVEFARIWEDDGSLGQGPGWSAGVEHWLTGRTSIAVEAGQQRHVERRTVLFSDPNGPGHPPGEVRTRSEGTATFVIGSVARQFGSARARPVICGGAGIMHHPGTLGTVDEVIGLPPGLVLPPSFAARRGPAVTALAFDGGAGVDVLTTDLFSARPYAGIRFIRTGNHGPKLEWRVGVRLSWGRDASK